MDDAETAAVRDHYAAEQRRRALLAAAAKYGPPRPGKDQHPLTFMGSLSHAVRASTFFLMHMVVVGIFLFTIWLIHIGLHAMGDPKLFDWFPLRYLFDVMDLAIVIVLTIEGVTDARRALKDHH